MILYFYVDGSPDNFYISNDKFIINKMKVKLSLVFSFLIISCGCESDNNNFPKEEYFWEEITLEEARLNETLISEAFERAENLNFIYSIIVIRYNKIAAERYFHGHERDLPTNIRSVSKSFLSAAIGIAVEKGIVSIMDKLTDIFPVYNPLIIDSGFFDITLENLIKMKSGLDRDKRIYSIVTESDNWLSTIFKMNLVSSPGSEFNYSTPGTHLLSAILSRASGSTSLAFMTENLLSGMGIEVNYWQQDPQGIYFGGNNMHFTTRNMALLGLLYMNNGKLNNTQIVPGLWITKSLNDYSGELGDWGVLKGVGYSYLWWLGEINEYNVFTAIGHGGQFVLCIPELEMVIATNAHSDVWWEEANLQELSILNLIGGYIIPAAK